MLKKNEWAAYVLRAEPTNLKKSSESRFRRRRIHRRYVRTLRTATTILNPLWEEKGSVGEALPAMMECLTIEELAPAARHFPDRSLP